MKICLACRSSFDSKDWICPQCGQEPLKKDNLLFFAPESAIENQHFPSDSFDRLVRYEDQNFWFRSRSKLILWMIKQYFPKAVNFLEVGCGNGYVLSCVSKFFPHLKLFGSEIYHQGLIHASKRLKEVMLFQMDARHIPFLSEFNVIGIFDVLEHIQEDQEVLSNLYQAVTPGGGIILTVPQHDFLWTYVDKFSGHVRRYSAQELKEKVKKAGFKVEDMFSFVSLLLPLMLLSRFTRGNDSQKYNPEDELRMNPVVNFLMGLILAFERLLIRWGIRFPWGGSLLLVARKV